MATVTIRNLPEDLVERIKEQARRHRRSMEQELRELLEQRYATRRDAAERIRERWSDDGRPSAGEVDAWLREARS